MVSPVGIVVPGRGRVLWAALLAVLCGFPLRTAVAIVITEINYNPGTSGEDLEFVEVFNDNPTGVDLSGAYFAKGIEFTFPPETYLKARSAVAVCANLQAMQAKYPGANLVGDFTGKLDNSGETILLVTSSGKPLAEVTYNDRGLWPATANGTGYTLSIRNPFDDVTNPLAWVRSSARGGNPGVENFPPPSLADNEIFPETGEKAVWRYKKGYNETTQAPEAFSTPPGAWRQPDFDDAAWSQGQTPIGYGETEIVTILGDMDSHYGSFALRKKFTLTEEQFGEMVGAILSIRVDDGYVAYLNGAEIGRIGLPGDAETDVPFDALSSSARELKSARALTLSLGITQFQLGENVLAVQVHNRRLTEAASDAGFVAALSYQTRVIYGEPPVTTVVINEVISRASAGARGIELFNTLRSSVDVGGYILAADAGKSTMYTIPAGTTIEPRGYLFVPESSLGFALDTQVVSPVLYGADGETPLDAASFSEPAILPASPQSHIRYPDGRPGWSIAQVPTPGAANQLVVEKDLVINEIHYNPKLILASGEPDPAPERGEFVEIYNRSTRSIALDGYALTAGFQYAFPAGTTLAGGGYLVVARDPKFIRETYGLPAGQVLGLAENATLAEVEAFGKLKNSAERIRLEDPLGNTADEVTYQSEGEWNNLADGGGSSLELVDPNQDNASPLAWEASDETHKAPWTQFTYTTRYVNNLAPLPMESELHIFLASEGQMLIDAISLLQGDPPAETITNGGFETDTKPWRLIGTHIHSVRTTDEAKDGSACLHVVATGSGDNRVNRIEVDTSPALKPGDVTVSFWARWLEGSNTVHVSGYNNAFGKTVWLPVPAAAGTPGKENGRRAALRTSTGSDNLGPVISHVIHEPAVPTPNQAITIRARVTDSDGVASVEALHQKDKDAEFQRVALFDDGTHDDGEAGDGDFAGEVPAYPVKGLVNFMLEAKDAGGRVSVFPRGAPEHTLLFAVDDAFQSAIFRYRLLVNDKELNTPATGLARRLLHSDELVRGTFIFEESQVYYDVGVRYHGSPWNRPPDPKMFRVRFNGDKTFRDGTKRINISRYGSVQNEGTSYQLIAQTERPGVQVPYSPRYTYINMKLNLGPHGSGALAEIRPVDGEYAAYNWPSDPDGQFWKVTGKLAFTDGGTMAGGGPDWTQLRVYANGPYPQSPDSPENYRFYFNPTVRLDEDSFEPLIRLLKTMDRSTLPDAEYDEAIQKIMNVDASLRVFAVRSLLADWDTVDIGNGQNAYIYYAPIEGRTYLVPWDMDHTFERSDVAMVPPNAGTGFKRLINRPMFKRQYARLLKELSATSWSEAYVSNWTKLVSETGTPGKVAAGTALVSFIRGRRTTAENFFKAAANVPFGVTTPSPAGGPGPSVAVEGTGGLNVAFILGAVNGGEPRELAVTWSTPPRQTNAVPTIWRVQVDGLAAGRNEVTLTALDNDGNLVGSKSIDLYDTTGWSAPSVTSIDPTSGPLTGGTPMTIGGAGFRVGAAVTVGGAAATEVTVVSETEITARTPAATTEGPADVVILNIDGQSATVAGGFAYGASLPKFRRGEIDGNGKVDSADVLAILVLLFQAGQATCLDAADIDDNGKLNVTDAVVLLLHLFQGGPQPPQPYDASGVDPTPDGLGCDG